MEQKTIDLEALANLATSWRGSNGEITISQQDCKFLRLKSTKKKPTVTGAVFVNTVDFVKAVDREVVKAAKIVEEENPQQKTAGESEEHQEDSGGPPLETSENPSEDSPESKEEKKSKK